MNARCIAVLFALLVFNYCGIVAQDTQQKSETGRQLDALFQEAEQAEARGDNDTALQDYADAQAEAERVGNVRVEIEAILGCARVMGGNAGMHAAPIEAMRERYERALELTKDLDLSIGENGELELFATNELCVFLMDHGNYDKAVETWRASPLPDDAYGALNARDQHYIYYYNYGRALEGTQKYSDAFEKYRLSFFTDPNPARRFTKPVEKMFELLRKGKVDSSENEFIALVDNLIATGDVKLASTGIHYMFLDLASKSLSWDLLKLLVDYYVAAGITLEEPDEDRFLTMLKATQKGRSEYGRAIDEIRAAYTIDFPTSRALDPLLFPAWSGSDGGTASFSSLLRMLGDRFDAQGKRNAAYVRYIAAWTMDKSNVDACLYAAALLTKDSETMDAEGRLLAEFVNALYPSKAGRVVGDVNAWGSPETWGRETPVNISRVCMLLGSIYARQGKWGDSENPASAIYQYERAAEAEQLNGRPWGRRHFAPGLIPQQNRNGFPGIHLALADAYSHTRQFEKARDQYLIAAKCLRAENRDSEAGEAETNARNLEAKMTDHK